MVDFDKERLLGIIEPVLQDMGCELVDLKVKIYHQERSVEIITDKPKGGITLDECSAINRLVRQQLQEDNFAVDDINIEVSSPGIDRPLTTAGDFKRVAGREVRFHLSQMINNKLEHVGKIVKADDTHVTVQVKHQDVLIPINLINKAVQVIK